MIQKAFGGKSSLPSMVALEKVGIFMDLASGYHISGKVSWRLGISCRRRLVTGWVRQPGFSFGWTNGLEISLWPFNFLSCSSVQKTVTLRGLTTMKEWAIKSSRALYLGEI